MKTKKSRKIYVNFDSYKIFDFSEVNVINRVAKAILDDYGIGFDVSINVSIVSSQKIRKLNRIYRKTDKVTDVLSFPNIKITYKSNINSILNDKKMFMSVYDFTTKSIFLGDIVICYYKLISQSEKYGHSEKREFAFLVTHSLLHLLGYDHINKTDEKIMFEKQNNILNMLKIKR